MKKQFLGTVLVSGLILSLLSCSGGGSAKETPKADTIAAPMKPVAVYVSSDGKFTFDVLEKTGDEKIRLKDESTGKEYSLSRSPSGSGVKYEDDNDYFFWMKGEEFMWGKGDSLYTSGKIRK